MSGADKDKPEPTKKPDETLVRNFETIDFSATLKPGSETPKGNELDAYATQFVERPVTPPQELKAPPTSVPAATKKTFPTDIPGFIVESELGRGAFGVVYAARDELLDRKVAIKKPLISNPAHRQQYIDEARKAVKLDHPSIVPIYQVGMTTNNEPFVVQKLIEGSTLRQMLQSGEGRLPYTQVIAIMRQVCLAVDAAHAAGIVHRDLKPENLLVEPDGRVYVADFGLAILEDDEPNKKGREVAGTPLYMSPEQFSGRVEWLDGRSDIWALGVILYEMLSGKTPFTGSSLNELKDQIKNKDPRPIHQRDPKIPSAFDAVFRKCCAKAVGDRYASARELIGDLDIIAEALPFMDTVNMVPSARTGAFKALSSVPGTAIGLSAEASQGLQSAQGGSSVAADSNTIGNATVKNAFGGTTLRQESQTKTTISPAWILLGLLLVVAAGAWIGKLGPFAVPGELISSNDPKVSIGQKKTGGDNSNEPVAGTDPIDPSEASKPNLEQKVTPKSSAPAKPYFVSVDGKGTHDSIAKAIADSTSGETITILGGTYRESLVIDRSIKLVGQGSVRIVATEAACAKVQGEVEVVIEKVSFDSQAPSFNAIEIEKGRLSLVNCNVYASSEESYNCVKVRPNATLIADKCKFQTTVHAAVSAEKLSSIDIRDSAFSFSGNFEVDSKRAGVQGIGASGVVRNCTFVGPCVCGIDWINSPAQELRIESCKFDNCDIGVQTKGCKKVSIKGSVEKPCEIKNAGFGLSIKQSEVDLSLLRVEGYSVSNRVGMQITESSKVNCTNCDFAAYACGILVNQSMLIVDDVRTRETSFVGMMVDGGTVEGKELNLGSVSHYGLAVLSKGASVKLESLKIDAVTTVGQKITPAVYVASGSIRFTEGNFSNCLCGIFVDPKRVIINSTGFPEKRSLVDLIGDPIRILMTVSPVEIFGDRMTVTKCDRSWIFNGEGACKIKTLDGDLPAGKQQPFLLSDDLELSLPSYLYDFVVLKKSGRE